MPDIQYIPKPPTEKQRRYARQIARRLQLELPAEYTAKAYFDFIQKNAGEYKHKIYFDNARMWYGNSNRKSYNYTDDHLHLDADWKASMDFDW